MGRKYNKKLINGGYYLYFYRYRHADNMYRVNGSMYWYRDEHVSVDLFRDYKITNVFAKYELHSSLSSTLKDFPSFSTHFKHYHNTTSVDTSGFVKVTLAVGIHSKKIFQPLNITVQTKTSYCC